MALIIILTTHAIKILISLSIAFKFNLIRDIVFVTMLADGCFIAFLSDFYLQVQGVVLKNLNNRLFIACNVVKFFEIFYYLYRIYSINKMEIYYGSDFGGNLRTYEQYKAQREVYDSAINK